MAAAGAAALVLSGVAATPPAGADAATDRCYVDSMHRAFLGRAASAYELGMWADRTPATPARPTVPRSLARSEEWLRVVVGGTFYSALDRDPDPEGLAFWVERLRTGTRVATLTAQVYGSDEFWNGSGATPEGFARSAFERLMGRQSTPDDVAYWASQVGPRGRGGVAKGLIGTIENRRSRVTSTYQLVLGRQPDAAGRDYWAGRLATIDDVDLAVQLATSPEAYQRAQTTCDLPAPPTVTTVTGADVAPAVTPSVSDDGRYVAFVSEAPILPGGRDDDERDLYVLDRTTGTLTRAVEGDEHIGSVTISADGRHVVFVSRATDLVPGEGGAAADVYSWDRTTGTITRVTDGEGSDLTFEPSISADGRFVAIGSYAAQGPDDPAGLDGYVWDRTTGDLERLEDAGVGGPPIITPDGSTVLYGSIDPVAPGDRPDAEDTFAWDRATGEISFVGPGSPLSAAADGDVVLGGGPVIQLVEADTGAVTPISTRAAGFSSEADIATDGRTVAFTSWGAGLFPGDTPNSPDVFVWERATGAISRISPAAADSAHPSTSGDGRIVVFHSGEPEPTHAFARITVWDRGS